MQNTLHKHLYWLAVDCPYFPSKHFLFFKTSSRRLEDVFSVTLFVFQDVFKTCLQEVLQLCLQDVFKTSWKTKKCYTEDVFSTSSARRMFAGLPLDQWFWNLHFTSNNIIAHCFFWHSVVSDNTFAYLYSGTLLTSKRCLVLLHTLSAYNSLLVR